MRIPNPDATLASSGPPIEGVADGAPPPERRSASANVVRGALAMLSTQPLTWASTLLVTVFVPRYLADTELGEASLVMTIIALVSTVIALGIPTALVRSVAMRPSHGAATGTAAMVLMVGLALAASVIMVLLWPIVGAELARIEILVVALANMVVGPIATVATSILIGTHRHLQFAWVTAANSVSVSVFGVLALVAGGGVLGFMGAGALAVVACTALAWWVARFRLDPAGCTPRALLGMARAGLPFLGMALTNKIRLDLEVLYLGLLVGPGAVGLWAAAGRVISMPLFIPTVIVTPLLPALTQALDDRPSFERALRRSFDTALLLTVGPSAGILALAPAIPDLLGWDPSYAASVPIMAVMVAAVPLIGVAMVLGTGLLALGEERRWMVVGMVSTVGHGLLNVALIAGFAQLGQDAALGTAWARVLTELLMIAGALWLLPSGLLGWTAVLFAGRVLLAALAVVVVAAWLLQIWLPLAVVGGGLAYGVALLALGAVRIDDMKQAATIGQAALRRRVGRDA